MDLVAAVLRNACRACTWHLSRLAPMGRGRLGESCAIGSILACGFRAPAGNERA
jgi:hypothetical protein